MRHDYVYLPNGIQVKVSEVFGGFKFTTKDHVQYSSFPPEWTVCLSTKVARPPNSREPESRAFTAPTLENDRLYISSLSLPSREDLKPGSASTRIAVMVLWVTFFWYFQEPEPTPQSSKLSHPSNGPNRTGSWNLTVESRGILSRKDQMVRIERVGLLASKDSSVGLEKGTIELPQMFISQRAFWALDPRVHLFSVSSVTPTPGKSYPTPSGSLDSLGLGFPFGAGPKTSGCFLPPYYPPQALQYTYTGDVLHPLRPKAYKQGEVFYVRFIPSGKEYLTLRVPVLPPMDEAWGNKSSGEWSGSGSGPDLCLDSERTNDLSLVYDWLRKRPQDTSLPRTAAFEEYASFLEDRLCSQNSFPVVVCWDSVSTGYCELFWVLEDPVGRALGTSGNFDRGIRCLMGNENFLKPKQLKRNMSSLVHYCWLHDQRTDTVILECCAGHTMYALSKKNFSHDRMLTFPRLISALESIGFNRVEDVQPPSENNIIMRIHRREWLAPIL
ncbi:acyl-CoA N-acyltransferase [Aspergillus desertorum]